MTAADPHSHTDDWECPFCDRDDLTVNDRVPHLEGHE